MRKSRSRATLIGVFSRTAAKNLAIWASKVIKTHWQNTYITLREIKRTRGRSRFFFDGSRRVLVTIINWSRGCTAFNKFIKLKILNNIKCNFHCLSCFQMCILRLHLMNLRLANLGPGSQQNWPKAIWGRTELIWDNMLFGFQRAWSHKGGSRTRSVLRGNNYWAWGWGCSARGGWGCSQTCSTAARRWHQ